MYYGLGIHFPRTQLPKSENIEHNTTKKKKTIKNIQYSVEDHLEKIYRNTLKHWNRFLFFLVVVRTFNMRSPLLTKA